jgi:hypothetical protein
VYLQEWEPRNLQHRVQRWEKSPAYCLSPGINKTFGESCSMMPYCERFSFREKRVPWQCVQNRRASVEWVSGDLRILDALHPCRSARCVSKNSRNFQELAANEELPSLRSFFRFSLCNRAVP